VGELDKKIKEFGGLFRDRLDNELLQDAINYVDYDERGLAFEIICEHISEYEVSINKEEYELAIAICNELQMDLNDISLQHLKELVRG